jgi:2-hydroxy-6-oxonona-2,4-dienedioate hydrolase
MGGDYLGEYMHSRIAAIGLLVALGAGAVWISYEYRKDIGDARSRVATGSEVISTACGPIEYAEAGSGPELLFIHGAGGGFDQGLALGQPLAERGYRVIAMSRFGYLRTPVPPHPSIALQAAAHACLLDALGIKSAAIIGVSAGAASALEFALSYPTRSKSLVLLVPGWFPPGTSSTTRLGPLETVIFDRVLDSDFLFWALTRFLPKTADRAVLGTPSAVVLAAAPSERERVRALLRDILPVSQRKTGLSLEGRLTTDALSKPLESLSIPTLTISVEDDLYGTYQNAQYLAQRIPQCRFVGYRTGGHMFVGHNEAMLSTVVDFLRSHGQATLRR